jgi:hypothetical protein
MPYAKISLSILFASLVLAGCAAQKEEVFPTTNPLEKICQGQGVQPGGTMTVCMRHQGALGMGRDACAKKGLKPGSPKGDACIKTESDYAEAEALCQAAGRIANQQDYDACVAEKAPEAVAAKSGKR